MNKMKCNAWVLKRGGYRQFLTLPPSTFDRHEAGLVIYAPRQVWGDPERVPPEVLKRRELYTRCNGQIIGVEIVAVEGPYHDSGPVVEINYNCDTCAHRYYPELPSTTDELEWILMAHLRGEGTNKHDE